MSKNKGNQKLLQDITLMMTDPKQATNEKKIKDIMGRIRGLNINKAPDQLRLASCHFMTMYHTRKAMTIGMPQQQQGMPMNPYQQQQQGMDSVNLKAVEKFKLDQRRDMELGWKLLNIKNSNSHAARTARVLKIEVAQRLEDSKKLKQAFEDLMQRNLTEEEIMVAFTAAPFLGDWPAMMKLGQQIEKMPGGLEQLHMMSLQLPIPDFTLVYDLVKFHKLYQNKPPSMDSLKWDLYNIKKIRVKFQNVDCGDYEEKRKELLQEIEKQGEVEWEEVPNCQHVHIKRMGALCQAVSFGEIPMMLNGPWFSDKIHVQGRAEMPLTPENQQQQQYGMPQQQMDPNNMTILVQEEEWFLKRSKTNNKLFKGIYTLKQRPELPPNKKKTSEHAPVNMTFECEIYLKDNVEKDKQYSSNNTNKKNEDTKEDDDDNNTNKKDTKNDNEEEEEVEDDEEEEVEEDELEQDPYKQLIDSQLDDVLNEELQTEFDGLQLD